MFAHAEDIKILVSAVVTFSNEHDNAGAKIAMSARFSNEHDEQTPPNPLLMWYNSSDPVGLALQGRTRLGVILGDQREHSLGRETIRWLHTSRQDELLSSLPNQYVPNTGRFEVAGL